MDPDSRDTVVIGGRSSPSMHKTSAYFRTVVTLHNLRDRAKDTVDSWKERGLADRLQDGWNNTRRTVSSKTRNFFNHSENIPCKHIPEKYSYVFRPKSRWELVRLSGTVCGIEFCYAAETAFVTPILLSLGLSIKFVTMIWCLSPLIGLFVTPILGSMSDSCESKFGRRRPFILMYSIGILLGLLLVPNGHHIGLALGDKGNQHTLVYDNNVVILNGTKMNANETVDFNDRSSNIRNDFSTESGEKDIFQKFKYTEANEQRQTYLKSVLQMTRQESPRQMDDKDTFPDLKSSRIDAKVNTEMGNESQDTQDEFSNLVYTEESDSNNNSVGVIPNSNRKFKNRDSYTNEESPRQLDNEDVFPSLKRGSAYVKVNNLKDETQDPNDEFSRLVDAEESDFDYNSVGIISNSKRKFQNRESQNSHNNRESLRQLDNEDVFPNLRNGRINLKLNNNLEDELQKPQDEFSRLIDEEDVSFNSNYSPENESPNPRRQFQNIKTVLPRQNDEEDIYPNFHLGRVRIKRDIKSKGDSQSTSTRDYGLTNTYYAEHNIPYNNLEMQLDTDHNDDSAPLIDKEDTNGTIIHSLNRFADENIKPHAAIKSQSIKKEYSRNIDDEDAFLNAEINRVKTNVHSLHESQIRLSREIDNADVNHNFANNRKINRNSPDSENNEFLPKSFSDVTEPKQIGSKNIFTAMLSKPHYKIQRPKRSVVVEKQNSPSSPGEIVSTSHIQPWSIAFTVIGTVLLDFCSDACQSPSRTYLLDVSIPSDHAAGLSTFTVMAGLGGSIGYAMGAVHWERTFLGDLLGGQINVVFMMVTIIFLICLITTVCSFPEVPMCVFRDPKMYKEYQEKFISSISAQETDNEMDVINTKPKRYGSTDETVGIENITKENASAEETTLNNETEPQHQTAENIPQQSNKDLYETIPDQHNTNVAGVPQILVVENNIVEELGSSNEHPTLKEYLKSIIHMPNSLRVLCLTNLFCWMSLVCYSLYFTDFVGECVFGGDPRAPEDSPSFMLYQDGVQFGCWGMALYSISCSIYSFFIEALVKKIGAKPAYVGGQLVYSAGMVVMAITRHKVAVILLSPTAGVMYSTLFTMPYLLIAHYHCSKQFSDGKKGTDNRVRGIGTDVAAVSSMVFLSQFILSLSMGSIVEAIGSNAVPVCAAALLSACGAVSATQVTYLDI